MPTTPWARSALYTPGQVWCPEGVSRDDVNPRPLSSIVPSNGLIGCVSADGKELLATAWEPYQELFQGVIVCLHSDFRIGGLKPGESKTIRGKIYLMPADFAELRGALSPRLPRAGPPDHAGASPERRRKKLIEFGWDEPGHGLPARPPRRARSARRSTAASSTSRRGPPRERRRTSPGSAGADGVRRRELKPARDDLESISAGRGSATTSCGSTSTPADLDWFDDHAAVVSNARLAAQLARAGRCRGILLDTEQYEGKLFDYREAARREAAAPGPSTPPRPAAAAAR